MHPLIDKFQSKAYCMFSVLYKIDLRNNLHPRGKRGDKQKKENSTFFSFLCSVNTMSGNRLLSMNLQKNGQCIYGLWFASNESLLPNEMNKLNILFQISNYVK